MSARGGIPGLSDPAVVAMLDRMRDDMVVHLYVGEDLTTEQIGELIGCSKTTVWRILKRCKVPMQPAGAPTKKRRLAAQKRAVELAARNVDVSRETAQAAAIKAFREQYKALLG